MVTDATPQSFAAQWKHRATYGKCLLNVYMWLQRIPNPPLYRNCLNLCSRLAGEKQHHPAIVFTLLQPKREECRTPS